MSTRTSQLSKNTWQIIHGGITVPQKENRKGRASDGWFLVGFLAAIKNAEEQKKEKR
jgi:hypothetical protein